MEVGGTYYNTKSQVRAFEDLLAKLPDLSTPAPSSPRRSGPGRARRLDADQVQRILDGYQAGSTVYELAEQLAIGRNTVCRTLHRHGITTRLQGLTPDDIDTAIRLHHRGWSPPRIATHLGVSAATIRRRLRDHDYPTHRRAGQTGDTQ
ncbi:MAG: hypothetical protein GEU98_08870 [Pseudonocardiaceae bacterium]|nr:hypothetical protein [Pseudonocardiaceae bacterium]